MFDRSFYEKEHKECFDTYRKKYENRNSYLFEDGVIDLENYSGILFLLKEAYSKEQTAGEWNLAKNLAEQGPWGMWNRVSEWTSGIELTTKEQIAPFCGFTKEAKRENLRKVAVINVKKVNGTATSDGDDLQGYVQENKDILQREILSVQPKIIVCGNTFRYLQTIFDFKQKEKCDNWYYRVKLGSREVLVLDYYHPAVQYPALLTYYGITNVYQQALLNAQK